MGRQENRLLPQEGFLRGTLKFSLLQNAGKTEKQSFPECGENLYILRIYKYVPPHGVTGVGEGRA